MQYLRTKTGILIVGFISLSIFLYLFAGALGDTILGVTLRSNPDLQDGLVAHYTFDSDSVSGFSVSDTSGNNDGYIVATSSVPAGVSIDASIEEEIERIHRDTSPNTVWIDENNGFVFYMDNNGSSLEEVWMASTSDGGSTWGNNQVVDTQNDCKSVAVWYDGWTKGRSGNLIHIVTSDSGDDELYYTTYNPTSNVLSSTVVVTSEATAAIHSDDNASITIAEDGTIYVFTSNNTDPYTYSCSSNCTAGVSSWSELSESGFTGLDRDAALLLPLQDTSNITLIQHDETASTLYFNVYSATSSSWWGTSTITTSFEEAAADANGKDTFGATLDPKTGEIFLAHVDDADDYTTQDHHVDVYKFDNETLMWSALTSPTGGAVSGGLDAVDIGIDSSRGYLYVAYVRRDTIGTETTGNLYWRKSIDGGNTWSGESGPLNSIANNIDGARINFFSEDAMSVTVATGTNGVDGTPKDLFVYKIEDIIDYEDEKVTSGKIGQGMTFDGVDDYVHIPFDASLTPANFTISMWVKRLADCDALYNGILKSAGGDGYNNGYAFICNNNNRANFRWGDGAGNNQPSFDPSSGTNLAVGQWHFLATTYDGVGMNYYVDGDLVQSSSSVAFGYSGSDHMEIAESGGVTNFPGSVDDVRLYDRALSSSSVQRLYDLGATTKVGKTLGSNPDLKNGLVGHWTFDGKDLDLSSNTAEIVDKSGSGNNGNWLNHATTTTSGVIGQALDFDGIDDSINYGDIDFTSSFTAMGWANPDATSQYDYIFNKNGGPGARDWSLWDDNGNWAFRISVDGTNTTERYSSPTTISNSWQHVAGVYNASAQTLDLYINGELSNGTLVGSVPASISATDNNLTSALRESTSGYSNVKLDDLRLFNRALNGDELKRIYDLGATTKIAKTLDSNPDLKNDLEYHLTFDGKDLDLDASTGEIINRGSVGGTGNWINHGTTTKAGKMGQALYFSGSSNEYIDLGAGDLLSTTTPFTLSLWVDTEVEDGGFFELDTNTGGHYYVGLSQFGSFKDVFLGGEDDIWSDNSFSIPDYPADLRKWMHISIVYDGVLANEQSSFKAYLDGEEVTLVSNNQTYAAVGNNKVGFAASYLFEGSMDDVRIYNRALSASEISRLYQLGGGN
jgi:hypothetical protein